MMSGKAWLAGLAIIALGAPSLCAQGLNVPASPGASLPAGGTSAIPSATSGLGSVGSATPTTGFCANLAAFGQKCKAALCASQFGQMLNSGMTGPLAGVTGGFIPSICPPPGTIPAGGPGAPPAGSAAATAAAIQASEANAKARVAAIEYLGTVDCARWPEAVKALTNGLRQDPNECVRFAAARALNSGCCCNQKVIESLRICVAGSTEDNAPAENSVRVKAAAFSALQHCLMCVPQEEEKVKPPKREGEQLEPSVPPPALERSTRRSVANPHIATGYSPPRRGPITYEEHLRYKPFSQTVDEARHTLIQLSNNPRPPTTLPPGQRSLFGALSRARNEIGAANLRRAREQGLVPPRPDQSREPIMTDPAQYPSGSGVEPAAWAPAFAAPGPMPTATPAPGPGTARTDPVPESVIDGSDPMSNAEPTPAPKSNARRGLIGMLFPSRGD
jgi:hypothetical protein